MTQDELKTKCEALAAVGDAQAAATLVLFARAKDLEAALAPFAAWYARYGLDIDPIALRDYQRAAALIHPAA